jgi:thiosulfate dehydrogenase
MKICSDKLKLLLMALVVMTGVVLLWSYPGVAMDSGDDDVSIITGGLLYDNWPKMVGAKPEGSHPLYPAEGNKRGGSSWRCKECHGWDYIGKDGRYSKGSHYTGIEGVLGSANKATEALYDKLSGGLENHDFSKWMNDAQLKSLALFINRGLIDMRDYMDSDGKAKGDKKIGEKLYRANCASCHGTDGNNLDFKSKEEGVQGIGWLANDNPQESLHKIRWGHPGSDMPSMVVDKGLSDSETADILAYSQTLN